MSLGPYFTAPPTDSLLGSSPICPKHDRRRPEYQCSPVLRVLGNRVHNSPAYRDEDRETTGVHIGDISEFRRVYYRRVSAISPGVLRGKHTYRIWHCPG